MLEADILSTDKQAVLLWIIELRRQNENETVCMETSWLKRQKIKFHKSKVNHTNVWKGGHSEKLNYGTGLDKERFRLALHCYIKYGETSSAD